MEIAIEECADGTWKVHATDDLLHLPNLGAALDVADRWMTIWKREVPVRVRHQDGSETVVKVGQEPVTRLGSSERSYGRR